MGQLEAKIRVCGSCKRYFVFYKMCPHCGFAHYGALWATGFRATLIGLMTTWIIKPNNKEVISWEKPNPAPNAMKGR